MAALACSLYLKAIIVSTESSGSYLRAVNQSVARTDVECRSALKTSGHESMASSAGHNMEGLTRPTYVGGRTRVDVNVR